MSYPTEGSLACCDDSRYVPRSSVEGSGGLATRSHFSLVALPSFGAQIAALRREPRLALATILALPSLRSDPLPWGKMRSAFMTSLAS